jgi:hypothetical protein
LEGEHNEAAVIFIEGDFGVYPQYMIEIDGERKNVSVFVFHRTFSLAREKLLAKTLIKNKFETAKRLAKDLPIFSSSNF